MDRQDNLDALSVGRPTSQFCGIRQFRSPPAPELQPGPRLNMDVSRGDHQALRPHVERDRAAPIRVALRGAAAMVTLHADSRTGALPPDKDSGRARDWRPAAWSLEHRRPKDYGRQRLEVTGADGGPVPLASVVVVPATAVRAEEWAANVQTQLRARDDDDD